MAFNIKEFICFLLGCKKDVSEKLDRCKIDLQDTEIALDICSTDNLDLEQDVESLKEEIDDLTIKDFNYDFIPDDWRPILPKVLVTDKFHYYGVNIRQDLTDLLDSSHMSREIAKEILRKKKLKSSMPLKDIFLAVYNFLIIHIRYVKNQDQYDKLDQWDNGDLALVSKKGDCDLSARAFIRVMKDVLHYLKINYDSQNMFLVVGMYKPSTKEFGHAWAECYIEENWYLFELTLESKVSRLKKRNRNYTPYFFHNNRKGWYVDSTWSMFL